MPGEVVYKIRCDPEAEGIEVVFIDFATRSGKICHTVQEAVALLPEEHRT